MRDTIRIYVQELFEQAPKTRRAAELQDELLENLYERYDDLIVQGEDPQAAYVKVVDGIGDVKELLDMLKEQDVLSPANEQTQRQKSALLVSSAVGLYILGIIPMLVFSNFVGIILFLVFAAVATMLLVYNALSQPKYHKSDDTLVENFKEWKTSSQQQKAVMGSIQSIIWILAVIVFLLFGFLFHLWHVAWVVFLIAAAVGQVVRLVFIYRGGVEK